MSFINNIKPSGLIFSALAVLAKNSQFRQTSLAVTFLMSSSDRSVRLGVIKTLIFAPLPGAWLTAGCLSVMEAFDRAKDLYHHNTGGKETVEMELNAAVKRAYDEAPRINIL